MGFWYTARMLRALRVANRFVSRIVANSEAVRRNVHTLERYPLDRIDVFYNGHDTTRFDVAPLAGLRERLGIGPSDQIVGMVANLNPWKRQADLLTAFARLRDRHPRAHLLFVGSGPTEAALRAASRRLAVEGKVHFLGGVEDAVPIVKHLTVAALCSESEGLSNAVIEYLASGKPVVCTNVGGNAEIVTDGENGFLVTPGDIDALTSRLDFLLAHPETCDAMGEDGRLVARRLTSRRMAALHMNLYARLAPATSFGRELARVTDFDAPLV
jgi:glycosyltransferase involved in cell wall biosynthesis